MTRSFFIKWFFAALLILIPLHLEAEALPVVSPADTIFFGGSIITVNPAQSEAEAMALQGGKIRALGKLSEMEKWKGDKTEMVDLKGKTLMPGFFEPHGHPFDGAFAQFYAVDVRPFSVTNVTELQQKIKQTVSQAKAGDWVLFNGLDTLLQKGVTNPTLEQMDEWAPKNPMIIIANSGHAAFGNTLAFQKVGITAQTPDPTGGRIFKTPDGKLSGQVQEIPAMELLLDPVLKAMDPQKTVEVLQSYYNYLASNGITTVSDMTFDAKSLPAYQALEKDPHLPVRLRLYEIARKDNKGTLPPQGGSDLVRQNGVKWWADGSPWQGTIAVAKPFLNNETTLKVLGLKPNNVGPLNYPDPVILKKWVDAYYQQGYQIAIHVEGELAIEEALDAIEAAMKNHPRSDARARLEHVPLITEAQLDRVKRLGLPISFLMAHLYYWGDVLPQMLGQERAERWNPVAWALKRNIPFTFHNDGPVTPASPLMDFQIAVLRQTRESGQVLGKDQRIPIEEAIKARTINAAHELFMEKQAGSLEPGKWADLVVLSADPRKVKPEEISKIQVEKTYLNGKKVWEVSSKK